jgi:small GTP-binding protein
MADKENNVKKDIKIILLGETGVGKTNLINVFFGLKFEDQIDSTLASYCNEGKFNYNNESYNYAIWDTAGQEKFRAISKLFIRDAQIILIVYSIINRKTFEQVNFWLNLVKENLENNTYILGLVANKIDLYEHQIVMDEEGKKIAKENNIDFLVTSALKSPETFRKFVNKLLVKYIEKEGQKMGNNDSIKINGDIKNKTNKKQCCK